MTRLKEHIHAVAYTPPLTKEQNGQLHQRLVSGDMEARNEMIEGNMALVVYRVDAYLRNAPQMAYYREDMIAEGMVGLCKAVDDMQRKGPVKDPRPASYLTKAIDRSFVRLVDEANTIPVSYKAQERARAEGNLIKPPRVVSDRAALGTHDPAPHSRDLTAELQEEISACCRNEREKKIAAMRARGYTDAQIGSAIGLSRAYVQNLRATIFKRFSKRCPEYKLLKDRIAEREAKENDREHSA